MPRSKSQPKALTLRAAAREIGVHASTLKRWIDDGEGPLAMIKAGPHRATVRIRRSDLDSWMTLHSRCERARVG